MPSVEPATTFDSASALRENFYENDMDANWAAESLDEVEALLT